MRKSLLALAVIVAACSSKKPNSPISASVSIGSGDAGTEAGAADAAAPVDGGAVPTGPTFFTGDAGAPPAADAGSGLADTTLDSAIDVAIATASSKVAPKMERETQPGRATLKEGEHFDMIVNLAPNRCYTIVGFSPPGNVTQLELRLYGPLPLNVEAAKSGQGEKAMPVIAKGASALCPILPIPASYKVDVVAAKGAGRIGVQLFARNR